MKRLEARVAGVVQGVGFRVFVRREVRRLGLFGWVRNTPVGEVEVVAEGAEEGLRELERLLRRGPPGARVDGLDARWGEPTREFRGFEIR